MKIIMHNAKLIVAGEVSRSIVDDDKVFYSRTIRIKDEYEEIKITLFANTKKEELAIIDKETNNQDKFEPGQHIILSENSITPNAFEKLQKKVKQIMEILRSSKKETKA